ncbi:MAG: TetR/AcrR family transcriptional regulator [Acidimicrobiales bacterium]
MSTRGADAQHALVVAAERLFAEHGIHGVSLRDVAAAAGQRNNSAVQYHFGDRRGLVAAVYRSHMTRIDARRVAMLLDLDVALDAGESDVAEFVRIVVEPLVEEVATSNGWYGRFLAACRWEPLASEVSGELEVTRGLTATVGRLRDVLADLPSDVRSHRLALLHDTVIAAIAAWEWARDRDRPHLPADRLADDVVATTTALLLVPTAQSCAAQS